MLSILLSVRSYELFLNFHLLGSAIFVSAVFIHIVPKPVSQPPVLYLLIAVGLRGMLSFLRFGFLFYRNVGWWRWLTLNANERDAETNPKTRQPFGRAKAHAVVFQGPFGNDLSVPGGVKISHVVDDALHLHVYPSRSWTFRPGQYVYLSLPKLSTTAFAQMHPFYIAWTYKDDTDTEAAVVIVRIKSGFTKNLMLNASRHQKAKLDTNYDHSEADIGNRYQVTDFGSVIIDGPYGNEIDVQDYGTIVLFATDVGVAGHLLYIEHLLRGHRNWEAKVRRIVLYWQIESESKL